MLFRSIPDGGAPLIMDLNFKEAADKLRVEHVELTVNIKHKNRGDLQFIIQSPSGFQAVALPRKPDDNADFTDYMFTSPRFWGENGQGLWKIAVTDTVGNGVAGTLVDAKLKIYGTMIK